MEKELKDLIKDHEKRIYRYVNERDELRNKIRFCSQHEFKEEQRIAQLKLDSMDMVVYDFKALIDSLKKLVTNSPSPLHP